jgi:roadblock/LC7 domain-containing protein
MKPSIFASLNSTFAHMRGGTGVGSCGAIGPVRNAISTSSDQLDRLVALDGVLAVGELGPEGTFLRCKATDEFLQCAGLTAQFCWSMSALFHKNAADFTEGGNTTWLPQRFWAYDGGDITVAVGGSIMVLMHSAKADLSYLKRLLVQSSSQRHVTVPASSTRSSVA